MLSPLEKWWINGTWCTHPCDKGYRPRDKTMLTPGFWRECIEAFGSSMGPVCVQTHLQKRVPLRVVLRQVSSGLQGARWKSII